jgi:class 3 adenylate cyclase/tetratricopeptide (TPR) repeat protein
MRCPKCQFKNPDTQKFCGQCGAKLEKICPSCLEGNPPGYSFCGECGHDLNLPSDPTPKDLTFDEKLDKIQRYLPKGLTEKILAQRDKIEGERKQVTVMFCDMEGFTALVDRLGPEDAYSIMDQVYEILIHRVHDYDGTVNEMTGDGIVALFGAPIALEDAPQRAIRSAYAIHREMVKFSDKIDQEKQGMPPLKMRIGIHTGPVVVGTLGNDLRVEFKAVGDTVNLASRMEDLAEPGATYVTEETFKLTEGFFRYESLGQKEVRGKKEPVKVYRVIAPSTRRTRFDVSAERGLTHLVGRERELDLLLDAFERAKAGKGEAISIMSEAGVGKSRLLYEFRKRVSSDDVTFLEGKCLSYSRSVAYHPVIDILKSNFNVSEGDNDSEIKEKTKKGLKVLGADEATTLPYLLELLSVKDSGVDKIMMSPEGKKDQTIEALKRIVLKGSEIRPLVMAIEDLHWVDKSSEDVLKYMLDSISGARILLILTYRPEFVHTWGGRSYHNQLNLNRLSNRESLTMANYLLGTEDIDGDLESLILEKTDGVPFFIEEFLKSLKDINVIEKKDNRYQLTKNIQNLTIPSTIQDVIMARIDSLPERAKEVLQTGSVIEREFGHDLIKRVTSLSEKELLSNLSVLKDSELLFERGIFPESTYIFKHALTQEVVYDSILTRRKKSFHWQVGNAIEEIYRDNIDEYYAILVEHFFVSEKYEKAAEYSKLTARKAEKTGSFNDSIFFTTRAIKSLEKLPLTEDVEKKIIDTRTALGLYKAQMMYYPEAMEAVDPIIDLAIKHEYKRRLAQIYTIKGAYEWFVKENYAESSKNLEEALRIAAEVSDVISSALASYWFGVSSSFNCEFKRGIELIQRTLSMNEAAGNLWGISVMKSSLVIPSYFGQGRISLAFKTSNEAIQVAEQSGDIYSKAMAFSSHGISCYGKGLFEEATEYLTKGSGLSEKIQFFNHQGMCEVWLGVTFFEIGKYRKSQVHYEKAIPVLEHVSLWPSLRNLCKIGIAAAKLMNNEGDVDLTSLYAYEDRNRVRFLEGWISGMIGKILLTVDDPRRSETENWIKKAIKADSNNGMVFFLGGDYALYADFFSRKGDRLKAKQNLAKAIDIFKECGADGWVEKYEKELTALS